MTDAGGSSGARVLPGARGAAGARALRDPNLERVAEELAAAEEEHRAPLAMVERCADLERSARYTLMVSEVNTDAAIVAALAAGFSRAQIGRACADVTEGHKPLSRRHVDRRAERSRARHMEGPL